MNWTEKLVRKKMDGNQSIRFHEETVPYLTFPVLEEVTFLCHGFSTRLGGVSTGDCAALNLSFTRGESEMVVRENFERIGQAIGFSPEDLVFSQQTHTTNVRTVTKEDRGKGFNKNLDYSDVDGLITNVPGLVLATFYADCVPLYMVDPVNKAIGLSHSGWKGTVGQIGKVTIETMTKEYGTDPKEVIAVIGPSICQECYEVSEDVVEQFRQVYPEKLWSQLFYAKENGKYQLNLWNACRENFLQAGLPSEHIFLPDLCTCCNSQVLFSHRASKGRRGNLAAFLSIKA